MPPRCKKMKIKRSESTADTFSAPALIGSAPARPFLVLATSTAGVGFPRNLMRRSAASAASAPCRGLVHDSWAQTLGRHRKGGGLENIPDRYVMVWTGVSQLHGGPERAGRGGATSAASPFVQVLTVVGGYRTSVETWNRASPWQRSTDLCVLSCC